MIQLSIITINFNNRDGLAKTFESISKLKKEGMEYIVIDALSNDGSQDLIQNYSEIIDQQLIEKDKGIYDGMNKGIQMAKGDYIIFMNSGDLLQADNLIPLLKAQQDFDIVYGDTLIHYTNGFERVAKASEVSELWKSLPFVHQSVLVKRELLQSNLFDLNYKYCSDYELFCRLESKSASFKKVDQVIAQIEAGGVSDEKRDEATAEVFNISTSYRILTAQQQQWFESEIRKGKRIQQIKRIIPKSWIKLALKLKYRK